MQRFFDRKNDEHRLWYAHGANLVGTHQLPRLPKVHLAPHDVISWNERNHVRHPHSHWLDFLSTTTASHPSGAHCSASTWRIGLARNACGAAWTTTLLRSVASTA